MTTFSVGRTTVRRRYCCYCMDLPTTQVTVSNTLNILSN